MIADLNGVIISLNGTLKCHRDSAGKSESPVWVTIRPIRFMFEHSIFGSLPIQKFHVLNTL
jgi:hypothetical protein